MFLRRSLVHLSYMYMICFMSVHLGAPPPPQIPKSWLRYCCQFRSPEEWPNEDGRFRPSPPPPLATRNRRRWW